MTNVIDAMPPHTDEFQFVPAPDHSPNPEGVRQLFELAHRDKSGEGTVQATIPGTIPGIVLGAVEQATARAVLPVLKRQDSQVCAPLAPPDTPGFNCDTFIYYWSVVQLHIDKFVVQYPEIAMISTFALTMLGLSFCLPQSLVTLLVGVPLMGVGGTIAYTIYENHEEFLENFRKSVNKHIQEVGQEGLENWALILFNDAPENFGCNIETAQYFVKKIQQKIKDFVIAYPEMSLITAIVCLILGLSFFLPSLMVLIITGVPVTALGITIGYSIYQQYEKFMESFSRSLARHARAAIQESMKKN